MIRQIQSLYERPNFYNKLYNRRDRVSNGCYRDIYDGSIYEELYNENILSNDNNISFMWYSDGERIFNSSKFNIWGFVLIINELPYDQRYKLENILLVALWLETKNQCQIYF